MAQKKIQKKPKICYVSNLIIPILYQKKNIIINYASGSEIEKRLKVTGGMIFLLLDRPLCNYS